MKCFIRPVLYLRCLLIIGINANPFFGRGVEPAKDIDFPSVVSLSTTPATEPKNHFCTGTLITSRHVLTAMHCLEDPPTGQPKFKNANVKVTFGSRDIKSGTQYGVKFYTTYLRYAYNNGIVADPKRYHDIAVVTLADDVSNAKAAVLSDKKPEELYGKKTMSAGWGVTDREPYPRLLQKVEYTVLARDKAQKNFIKFKTDPDWVENHLCTIGKPPGCHGEGDSGGPLFFENKLVGVNSHVYPGTRNIKHANAQNTHASVHYYKKFIQSFKKKNSSRSSHERRSKRLSRRRL